MICPPARYTETHGNPFAQLIHDGGTLANHAKYLALGLQLVMPDGGPNMLVAVALAPSPDNTGPVVAARIKDLILTRAGREVPAIATRVISDGAALHVATHLGLRTLCCGVGGGVCYLYVF